MTTKLKYEKVFFLYMKLPYLNRKQVLNCYLTIIFGYDYILYVAGLFILILYLI